MNFRKTFEDALGVGAVLNNLPSKKKVGSRSCPRDHTCVISSSYRTGKPSRKGNQVRGPAVARVSIRARTWAESYKNKGLHLRPSSVFVPFSSPRQRTRDSQPRRENSSRRREKNLRWSRIRGGRRWVQEQASLQPP